MGWKMDVSLGTHTLKVKYDNEYLQLDTLKSNSGQKQLIPNEDKDLLKLLDTEMSKYKSAVYDCERPARSLIIGELDTDFDNRYISGELWVGELGIEEMILHRDKDFEKLPADSPAAKLFYFLIYIPEESDNAIVIVSKRGVFRIKEVFVKFMEKILSSIISERLTDVEVIDSPPKHLFELYADYGEIKSISQIRYGLDNNDEGFNLLLNDPNLESEDIIVETTYKVRKNVSADRLKDVFLKKGSIISENCDEIKTELTKGGQTRTFVREKLEDIHNYVKIDNVDEKDKNPLFSSLDSFAKEYLEEFLNHHMS